MKKWENPELKGLSVCCTKFLTNSVCGGEVNVLGNGDVQCKDWTKGQQKFDNGNCIYARDNKGQTLENSTNNGVVYCSNYVPVDGTSI